MSSSSEQVPSVSPWRRSLPATAAAAGSSIGWTRLWLLQGDRRDAAHARGLGGHGRGAADDRSRPVAHRPAHHRAGPAATRCCGFLRSALRQARHPAIRRPSASSPSTWRGWAWRSSAGCAVQRARRRQARHGRAARAGGRTESAEFRFVVGCDGAHSAVRHAAGIGFPGDAFPMEFMLGDVMIDWDVPRGLAVFAIEPHDDAPPDFVVVIPQPERQRYRISMLAPAEPEARRRGAWHHGGPARARRSSRCRRWPTRCCPASRGSSDLRWSSRFRISMRIADKYRAGNLFIAGDAAHIHPPTGGQGMNTGIQDAYNLAWKMALVLRGAADEALLDSYEAERRPVGVDVVERTKAGEHVVRPRAQGGSPRRHADPGELSRQRLGREAAGRAGAACRRSRAGCARPAPGSVGFPLRLFDVLRGTEHVVVVFRARGSRCPAGARNARARPAGAIRRSGPDRRGHCRRYSIRRVDWSSGPARR